MKRVRYERGRINIAAPPEVVACLWSNWEIYDALLGRKFRVARTGPASWTANYFLRVSLTLVHRDASLDAGQFVYRFNASPLGLPASTVVTLRYVTSGAGHTSVHGEFENDLPGLLRMVEPLVRWRITRAVDAVIEGGQASCELVSKSYEDVRQRLSADHVRVIDHYLDTGRRLRDAFFENDILSAGGGLAPGRGPHQAVVSLQDIERRIDKLKHLIGTFGDEIHGSVKIARVDLRSALATNRRIVEQIATKLYLSEIGPLNRKGEKLDTILHVLRSKAKGIPQHVFAHMDTVRDLGNIGAHPDPLDDGAMLIVNHFEVSVNALLIVVEWYFLRYAAGQSTP
jgi:hypothetical protein